MSTLLRRATPSASPRSSSTGPGPAAVGRGLPQGVSADASTLFVEMAVKDCGGPSRCSCRRRVWPGLAERWWARLLRSGSGAAGAAALLRLYTEIDVRAVLPTISAPTLVLQRKEDRLMPRRGRPRGRGRDPRRPARRAGRRRHLPIVRPEEMLDEVEEFAHRRAQRTPASTAARDGDVHRHRRLDEPRGRARGSPSARARGAPRRAGARDDLPAPRPRDQDDGGRLPGHLSTVRRGRSARRCRARCRPLPRPRDPRGPAHRRGRGDAGGHRRHRREHRRARRCAGRPRRGARCAP